MTQPLIREFRLAGRNGDGFHPFLGTDGAFIGIDTPLLEKDTLGRWRPRPRAKLETVLSAGYGVPVDLNRRMANFGAVARALNKGDRSLAAIALVHAQLPPLPDTGAAARLAKADRGFGKYDEDQPRVPAGQSGGGQWTSGGAAAATVATATGVGTAAEAASILSGIGRGALAALTDLGATLTGPLLVGGLIVIPTNTSAVSDGSLPDHPEISYHYDEGELTIYRVGADGTSSSIFSGLPDRDGLYRDSSGNVIGRNLGTSVALDPQAVLTMPIPAAAVPSINERGATTVPIPDTPECDEQWKWARTECERQLSQGRLRTKDLRGRQMSVDRCMRGYVSEACGGNPVARKWYAIGSL